MQIRNVIRNIAYIELLIGLSTITGLMASPVLSLPEKPANVFVFVLVSAVISTIIGLGILIHRPWARTLLVFFSGYIIITKILIFAGLLYFSGEMVTFVPAAVKNLVSVGYHSFVFVFFTRLDTKTYFCGMAE